MKDVFLLGFVPFQSNSVVAHENGPQISHRSGQFDGAFLEARDDVADVGPTRGERRRIRLHLDALAQELAVLGNSPADATRQMILSAHGALGQSGQIRGAKHPQALDVRHGRVIPAYNL